MQSKQVLAHIAKLHLIREKINSTEGETFSIEDSGWSELYLSWNMQHVDPQHQLWSKEHDRYLLQGVLKYPQIHPLNEFK